MTGEPVRLTVPDVLARFRAYHDKHVTWGALHIVLDDGNVKDSHVDFCIQWAREHGDAEGEALAMILRKMTQTQRARIGALA